MRLSRSRFVSVLAVFVLAGGMVVAVATPANAALPPGPATTGVTGARPGATEISFGISDQVTASVDVGTGNLRVQNVSLSLPGVTSAVAIGQTYNSLGSSIGATSIPAANKWSVGILGIGYLSAGSSSSVIYTAGDGATWVFTPTGTAGAYTSPPGVLADLAAVGSGFQLTFRETRIVASFNSIGQPTSIADRNGNTTTIGYTSPGNPNSVTSTAGPVAARTATLAYSASTYTLTATQASGSSSRSVAYVKDAASNLVKITGANGKDTVFGYTGSWLTSITAPGGAVTTIVYDSSSQKVASVAQANTTSGSPGTSVTRFAYPSATQTLLARPNTNQSAAVSAVPRVTYTVDATSKLVTGVVDEMGRSRGATYTPNGDTATSTQGSGASASTTTATYGANGGDSLTALQSPSGATSTAAYANTAAATQYLPSSTTNSSGNTTTYTYNGAGNPLTTSNAMAATSTLTFNTNGTVATALAPGNGTNKTIYAYNSNFQLSTVTPVTGTSLGVRTFTYDDFGRVRTATDGKGVTLTYTYDKQDRLLSTAFTGGTATVTNTYFDNGLPKTRVDANGTTTYGYDQLGRLISRVNTFAGGTITYGYDKSSNLITVTDGRGTTTNAFDNSGVATKITYASGSGTKSVNLITDDQGRRTDSYLDANATNTFWLGHTRQEYDHSGRVSRSFAESMTDGVAVTVSDISYCYNSGSAAPTCSTNAATDRSKLQWERNNKDGRVTAYTYDNAGRLTSATQTGGASAPIAPTTWTYTYDVRGNRLTATATGGITSSQTLAFNAANQITTTGYAYDGAGNMTADPAGTYTYNGAEQMTTATNASGTFTYKYAGTSQAEVLQQQTPTATYKLVYGRTNQAGLPVIESAQIGSVNAYLENDSVTGQPLVLRTSTGTASMYVYSGTGNPTALLRDNGSTAYTYRYDPYGVPTLSSSSGGSGVTQNPYLFKGGIQDRATGWVHFGNRWYNPTTGVWTQQDTLDAPLDPNNANRYAYAGCDPVNNSDPTGRALPAQVICAVPFVIVGILADGALALAGIPSAGATWAIGAALTIGLFAFEQATCNSL